MERRSEERIPVDQPVVVRHLDGIHDPSFPGRIVDVSGRGMQISVPMPLPISAAVVVEFGDCLHLGEVAYCRPVDSLWHVGLMVHERFRETPELVNLRNALAEYDAPVRDPVE